MAIKCWHINNPCSDDSIQPPGLTGWVIIIMMVMTIFINTKKVKGLRGLCVPQVSQWSIRHARSPPDS